MSSNVSALILRIMIRAMAMKMSIKLKQNIYISKTTTLHVQYTYRVVTKISSCRVNTTSS